MEADNQCKRILKALKSGPINPMQSWERHGVYRLGARIFDLREAGHDIRTRSVKVKNRFGEECRVAEYYLVRGNA